MKVEGARKLEYGLPEIRLRAETPSVLPVLASALSGPCSRGVGPHEPA